jgi:hypothetical protein
MRRTFSFHPGNGDGFTDRYLLHERRQLLSDQNAEKADKRDDRRRRGANVQERVDHSDQQADGEREHVGL